MTDKPHVYNLPGEVAAAISTNRPQFVTMLIDKVRNGHVIEQKHVIGVLEVFRDIVQMRADDRARVQRLERYIKRLTDELSLDFVDALRTVGRARSSARVNPSKRTRTK